MKLQDILFLGLLVILFIKLNPKYFVATGLLLTLVSIPLFAKHVFFTAERFVQYAVVCFTIAIILFLVESFKSKAKN